ncbi:3-hydroxyacyl-CoA dehydrogenase, NAD binding domain protein [Teladorsagia circumcincta]|uniref:3-hydroxyacyl-CoA dehydrogenase, NAD binding domain protein n=1 Tax=Teladorsagia circumcincta TaxID=45464 RepID=A0A2G9V1F2_TELCI|nr:3-hydroxyacyl-CoA dehydrogenase, NAD binding domain protein [Teladorsagia circumcincta]
MRQLTLCADVPSAVCNAVYIIEAVVEKKEVKEAIFTEAQNHCPPNALLITNTSSIRLVDLLPSMRDHARFAGLHFFNPVPVMKLVEVVSTPETSNETHQKLVDFCKSLGKQPVSCKVC